MVMVRSIADVHVDVGRQLPLCSSGSAFLTASTVEMMLAPGWRVTAITIDRRAGR